MIRKIPILTFMALAFHTGLWAQSQGSVMKVTLADGTVDEYPLSARPSVTVDDQTVTVENKGETTTYGTTDVKNYTFASSSSNPQEFIRFIDNNNLPNVVFPLSRVRSITSSTREHSNSLSEILQENGNISLFVAALNATGMVDSLKTFEDTSYSVGKDSIDWTNNRLCIHASVEYDNVAYMEHRYIKHTVFVEPNDVFARYGITSLDDLKLLAAQIYNPKYPEDASVTDLTDRRNSLNRFVSYHILPFQGTYYNLTCVDGPNSTLARNFNRREIDITDWYETMMPYSTMKFSFPSGSENGLYINRRGVQSRPDGRGFRYRGAKVLPASDVPLNTSAVNGLYHYIDDIISYGIQPDGTDIQAYVFSDRMRVDCTTLSPDFITSGARGHYTRSNIENGKYGRGGQGSVAANNVNTCLGFKAGSAANFQFTGNTHMHVRNRVLNFWSYGGDEVLIKGRFDVTVKLPPVPEGNYELRFGCQTDFSSRGIIAYFIDGEFVDMVDMRPSGKDPKIGVTSDEDLGGDEEMTSYFDHVLHNRGWMKGPASYWANWSESGDSDGKTVFRDTYITLRRVIGRFHSDGKSDHYLRLRQMMESENNELNFDYIEIVPECVYGNPDYNEDRL